MLNNQQKKENKFNRKIIRTCIHQPFEFNMRTLDQTKSQELAKSIVKISDILNVKFGIKSAIRKLRTQSVEMIAVILILDQSIMEIMLQAATVFWKYEIQIILAREDAKAILTKHFKINTINCIYIYNNPNIEQEQAQTIEEFKSLITICQQESKCEIPIIIDDQDIKLKQLRILHHTQLIELKQKEKQTEQKTEKQTEQKKEKPKQQQQQPQQQQQQQQPQQQEQLIDLTQQKIVLEPIINQTNENETKEKQSEVKDQQIILQPQLESQIQQDQVFNNQLIDNQNLGVDQSIDIENKIHKDIQKEEIEKDQMQIEDKQ